MCLRATVHDVRWLTSHRTNNVAGFSDLHFRLQQLQQRVDIDNASVAVNSAEGSSVVQTDYNFALKRFLLDTESVFDEALEASPQENLASMSQAESNNKKTRAGHFTENLHPLHNPVAEKDSNHKRRLTAPAEKRKDESSSVAVVDSEGEEYFCVRYDCILPSIVEEFRSQRAGITGVYF